MSFSDVAGCDGSRRELSELVDFLKDPDKFSAVGARCCLPRTHLQLHLPQQLYEDPMSPLQQR